MLACFIVFCVLLCMFLCAHDVCVLTYAIVYMRLCFHAFVDLCLVCCVLLLCCSLSVVYMCVFVCITLCVYMCLFVYHDYVLCLGVLCCALLL